jgi:DNA modification methylase
MINEIITGNNVDVLRGFDSEIIDLTVTSPPYDNLRIYNGYSFDFENLVKELYRVTKQGCFVVWVVGDATNKDNETGTSFKQALFFKDVGFNLLDTMIFLKRNPQPLNTKKRYNPSFEYMFVFSKGSPKTVNLIKESCIHAGKKNTGSMRNSGKDDLQKKSGYGNPYKDKKTKNNVWEYVVGRDKDQQIFKHPAIFPEKLAEDHVISWSNPGDIVLDPFGGSGTTAKMAKLNGRNFIHIDISEEYNEIARQRIEGVDVDGCS